MPGVIIRDLYTAESSRTALYLLRSIFVAEFLQPSKHFWIVSPWVSDIELVDNNSRQFSTLCPEWPANQIRLSSILASLIDRGTRVILVTNNAAHNDDFNSRMQTKCPDTNLLKIIQAGELHQKGILGDRFTVNGSMNLTFNGVYLNDEHITFRCDVASVEERRLELENRWRSNL